MVKFVSHNRPFGGCASRRIASYYHCKPNSRRNERYEDDYFSAASIQEPIPPGDTPGRIGASRRDGDPFLCLRQTDPGKRRLKVASRSRASVHLYVPALQHEDHDQNSCRLEKGLHDLRLRHDEFRLLQREKEITVMAMTTQTKNLHTLQSCLVCLVMACLSATASANKEQAEVHSVSTDMVTIMTLLLNHDSIRFTIQNIPGGERTTTTSKDLATVKAVRLHAREMRARVQQGNNIRPNDPLFVEIFRRHKEINDLITDIPGGVSEDETSPDPQVVLLIRAHAQVVASFVRQGLAATHLNTPLPKGYHADASNPAH